MKDPTLRSADMTEGSERTAHRALFYSLGVPQSDFHKPMIAIVNSWNEIVPGCKHLPMISQSVKAGVYASGGIPYEFNTIAVCDGMAQGHIGMRYSLPSREIIAASAEIMLEAHRFDGAVFISSCDKVTPGMLMCAARVNIPSVFVCAGAMLAGEYDGKKQTLSTMREYAGKYQKGELSLSQLQVAEEAACPSLGSCSMMGTANTMACITEALGLSHPESASVFALSSQKLREAQWAGERVVRLVEEGLRPRDIMTAAAFENAIRVSMAIGASTNCVIHIPAIAKEAGISVSNDDFERIGSLTPTIAKINPSGSDTLDEFQKAGGVPAVMASLRDSLNLSEKTVCGCDISAIAEGARWADKNIIRPVDKAFDTEGGLKILYGNLAPEGAICKRSACKEDMWKHSGPARVFDSMEEATEAVRVDSIQPGSVIVIRYEGRIGGPGMREMQMITAMIVGSGLADNTALITDGRFSGSTRGPCIGYISPEAAVGGPLAVIKDGEIISLDLVEGTLNVDLSDEEISRRQSEFKPPERELGGVLKMFVDSVKADNAC